MSLIAQGTGRREIDSSTPIDAIETSKLEPP
jgi:hypothetical protein